jgi:hypothetical protein
MGISDWV